MRQGIIYNCNGWVVTSYGNGTAYELRRDDKSVFLQGDDTQAFRDSTMDADGYFLDDCEERFGDYSDVMEADSD